MSNIIETKKIEKSYNIGKPSEIKVLKGIDLQIKKGEFAVIMGPSGSGKTTLLDIIGCLLSPTTGVLLIDGKKVDFADDGGLARIRRERIGFVFQQYNLITSASAIDNVEFPMRICGMHKSQAKKRAAELLKLVGLEHRMNHRPGELSGGEQQRVAIARSLANRPQIILGDEPTGNLDTKTGDKILELLKSLNQKGYTIVIITHDPRIKSYADRIIRIKDGEIDK